MKSFSQLKTLQASLAFLFTVTLFLRFLGFLLSNATINLGFKLLSQNRILLLSSFWCVGLAVFAYFSRRRRPVLLLDYSCLKPNEERKCGYEISEYFVRRSQRFTTVSEEFMRGIYLKSGLGDETYAPPFIFQTDYEAKLQSAVLEAEEGMFTAVDSLLMKTRLDPAQIDILIVTCGMFTPSPSLSSLVVNRYKLRDDIKTYNLSGMGCSSGVLAVDLAGKLLNRDRKIRYALLVVTESISLNWYFGDNRSMLVTNCIFRVGTAAALLTNDPARLSEAKMELVGSLRTHHGSDDASYKAAFQEEDADGNIGIALTKNLIRVAAQGLRDHIRTLGPRVLPVSQLIAYVYSVLLTRGEGKPHVPDFSSVFDHFCIHTGGKAVIEQVAKVMKLGEEVTEPARMCLHRFGNTSSSLVFYELAYFEGKGRVKKGDKMWMLAFGTGFKVGSLILKALKDSRMGADNPWKDCIHRYPVKAW